MFKKKLKILTKSKEDLQDSHSTQSVLLPQAKKIINKTAAALVDTRLIVLFT